MPTRKTKTQVINFRQPDLIMAGLQLLQGILILVFSAASRGLQPLSIHYLAADKLASQAAGHNIFAAANRHLYDLNLAYVVAAFFFVSTLTRLAASYRPSGRWRWLEYAAAGGLMMAAIAMLSGIYNIAALVMIFLLTAAAGLAWLAGTRFSYWLGALTQATAWLAILIYIIGALVFGGNIPAFVYWIYVTLFVLISLMAANTYLQLKRTGKWRDGSYAQQAHMALMFVATAALGWQIFFGALR